MQKSVREIALPDTNWILHTTIYTPTNVKPVAVLQICHGMHEHMRRYEEIAEFLTQRGIIVFGADHLGHGETATLSGRVRGDIDFENGTSMYTTALYIGKLITQQYPDLQWFVLGHSMGSYIVRHMLRHESKISGTIIVGSTFSGTFVKLMYALCRGIWMFRGKHHYSTTVENILGRFLHGRTKGINRYSEWLTHDTDMLESFRKDSTVKFRLTIRSYSEFFKMNMDTSRLSTFMPANQGSAVLLMSGLDDPLAENGSLINKLADTYKKCGVGKVNVKLYENARHCLLHEICRKQVFEDIYSWILSLI